MSLSPRKLHDFVSSTWVRVGQTLEEMGITVALLSRDQIWGANDLRWEDVPVPEWGGEVRIKGLSGRERDKFEADSMMTKRGGQRDVNLKNLRARLVVACAVDENFQPLFSATDVMRLGEKSALALERVFNKAQSLSGMSEDDIEELAGNSGGDQSDSSTSD